MLDSYVVYLPSVGPQIKTLNLNMFKVGQLIKMLFDCKWL